MRNQLFRQEVLDEQTHKIFGSVLITTPHSARYLIYILISIFVVCLGFLSLGSMYRKERAKGFLVPSAGLVKLYAPRLGTVDLLKVSEGQEVESGQLLFELSDEQIAGQGEDVTALKRQELQTLLVKLEERKSALPVRKYNGESTLKGKLALSEQTLTHLEKQLAITTQRSQIRAKRQEKLLSLSKDGTISADEVEQERDQVLQLGGQLKEEQQALILEKVNRLALEEQIRNLDATYRDQEAQILQEISQVKRDLLDLNLQSRRAVHAPVAGKVTSVQAYSGMAVDLAKPLMTILPQNSNLEANLFVPTRAVGLLAKGQKVLIQYEAFPYQKYGIHEGTIRYISRSVLNPKEISGIDLSHEFEPLYRVVVAINSQTIQAGGAVIPLQAGMSIKADIVLESRTLLEWLFEPFFHFGA